LVNRDCRIPADDIETEDGIWISEVLHIELTGERFVNVIAVFVLDAEDENVLNIYGDESRK
jgi:hypothetical protein